MRKRTISHGIEVSSNEILKLENGNTRQQIKLYR